MTRSQYPATAEELVATVRAEVRRRRQSAAGLAVGTTAPDVPAPHHFRGALPAASSGFETASRYVLDDLLAWHDVDFVDAAYRAVLRRPPDAAGKIHFLQSIRTGALSKVEVLGRLRYSPEGRRQRVSVKGLATTFAVQQSYRLPLVGSVIALGVAVARLPRIVRSLRAFEGYQHHRNQTVDAKLKALDALERDIARSDVSMARLTAEAESARLGIASLHQRSTSLHEFVEATLGTVKQSIAGLDRLTTEHANQLTQVFATVAAHTRQFHDLEAVRSAEAEQHRRMLARHDEAIGAVSSRAEAAHATGSAARDAVQEGRRLLADLQDRVEEHGVRMLDSERKLWKLIGMVTAVGNGLAAPAEAQSRGSDVGRMDALYFALEQRFRGTREDIRRRLSYYLPLLREALGGNGLVLDVGCGRGEWLELLRDEGLKGVGVDASEAMVAACRARGLHAAHSDALEYLRALPDASLGAVSGFHIIEHIGVDAVIALLDEARRALRPGGLLILETPNPENVAVGACSFWMDPSHRKPIPPALAEFLAEARGFTAVEIHRVNADLSPSVLVEPPTDASPALSAAVRMLRGAFEVAPDYAVIGRAP